MTNISVGDSEVRRVQILNLQTTKHMSLSDHLSKFSLWCKLLYGSFVGSSDKSASLSTVQEREEAWRAIIRHL